MTIPTMRLLSAMLSLFLCQSLFGQAWMARHNLTGAQYQIEFNKWTGQGYRLTQISGFSENGTVRYNALFEKSPGPASVARHGLNAAQYQIEFTLLTSQGYRPVVVSGYPSGNQARYAAIFVKESAPPQWVARHGLSAAEYQTDFDKMVGKGFQLFDVSGYHVGGKDLYATIWEKRRDTPQWVARHGLSATEYQQEFNKWEAEGYYLFKISGYAGRYAAIWRKGGPAVWQARHGIVGSRPYQDEFERLYYQGYRPVWINGATVNNRGVYSGIWVATDPFVSDEMQEVDGLVNNYMRNHNVPGLSFAIARNGKLVLAKSYGHADKEAGERTAPRHRFRVASVSKPLTSVAAMRLIEENKLRLNELVFGSGAILGTTYGSKAYSAALKQITVEHLLTHTSGGWPNDTIDPMFQDKNWSMKQLIHKTLDTRALTNAPGTAFAYSNFGYCLLGRIIEKKTGRSYADYLKNDILRQCNITRMDIGGNTLVQRKTDEVKYYGPGAPYNMNVTRMDAHGGWIASPIDLARLLVRVDRFNTVPDILPTARIDNMILPIALSTNRYAKGWSVAGGRNYWHNGNLPGTISEMVRTDDGFCWAIVANTRPASDSNAGALAQLMWDIRAVIHRWPDHDLF